MVVEGLVLDRPASVVNLGIARGTYTEIVEIVAPASATAGELVDVTVRVKNIDLVYDHVVACVALYDRERFIDLVTIIPSGETHSFPGSFTMPNKDVTIYAWSYYPFGEEWIVDDSGEKDVRLAEVIGWQPLATTTLPLGVPVAPPVGWQPLDSAPVRVNVSAPPVIGWQPLATTTVDVAAGPFPPWWELIEETIYHWGYIYRGDAEVCTFTFKFPPEQIPGMDWLAKTLVGILASTLEDHDSKLLELKLWRNTQPVMWTDYKCEVTASASPLAWWAILAIVCGVIVAITFLIREIRRTFFEPHGLPEDIKQGYDRNLLIQMICETPPEQTPESLEEMSDDELRTLLNEKLAAAAPKPWPWYVWLGITGVAIAGSLVAVTALRAFAPKKE